MPSEIFLVKVGMTMTEGSIEEWYVADGASVSEGEMLYRLETEKVNMDVDAESSGTVRHVHHEGTVCEPGDVIGYIYAEGEEIPETLPPPTKRAEDTASPQASATRDAGRALGEGAAANDRDERTAASPRARIAASPSARRLAEELRVDLATVTGTGPRGRITREDVEAAARQNAPPHKEQEGESIPVSSMRRTIARRMHESLQAAAQLTMEMEVCMDAAVALRERLVLEWQADAIRPTYTDLVVAAVAKALESHRLINSEFRETEIVLKREINIGLAVALDAGLVVPVIRHANELGLRALARESSRLAEAARKGTLGLDDVSDGTFTVSPLGMFGVDSFTPILNLPQAGILGVNRIYDGLGWDDDTPVRRKMMRLSLTWDHRVLDGAPAAAFLRNVCELLEIATFSLGDENT